MIGRGGEGEVSSGARVTALRSRRGGRQVERVWQTGSGDAGTRSACRGIPRRGSCIPAERDVERGGVEGGRVGGERGR